MLVHRVFALLPNDIVVEAIDRVRSIITQRVQLHRPDSHVIGPLPGELVVGNLEVAGATDADVVANRRLGHSNIGECAFMHPRVEALVQPDHREGQLRVVKVTEGAAVDLKIQQHRFQIGDGLVVGTADRRPIDLAVHHHVFPFEIVERAFLRAVEDLLGVVDVEGPSRRIRDAKILEQHVMALAGDHQASAVVIHETEVLKTQMGDVGEIVGLRITGGENRVGIAQDRDRRRRGAGEVAQRKAKVGAGTDQERVARIQLECCLCIRKPQVA